ncbi:MAG: hypothetical protein A3K77_01270 [Euryarchaeota archaeon RBG_13_31_8]|nr:MAG: hypothetical protein A3K77_01270 [Euryarchaeota archaeon RBG_13_31_8]
MGGKPYKNWEEVKKDINYWNNANKCCLIIALLFLIVGVVAEAFSYDLILAPTSFFIIAIFFAVVSIAPHISFIALKSWYGVESERKNK